MSKKVTEPIVLVGFGKYSLLYLMSITDKLTFENKVMECFQKGYPPVYRRVSICSEEEIDTFKKFTILMTQKVIT